MGKVALRGLLARRTRLILTSLAIALGVTLIAGTYIFTDTINASFDRIFLQANKGADVAVTPDDEFETEEGFVKPLPQSVLDSVRRSPGVQQAEGGIFDQGGTILGADGERVGSGGSPNFIGSARSAERFEAFQVAEGRLPRDAGEVALDKATAGEEELAVGDRLQVQGQKAKRAYTIVGLTRIAGVDSFGGAAVALLTLSEAQRVAGKEGQYDEIQVQGRPGTQPEALRAELRAALPRDVAVRTGNEEAAEQSRDIREDLGFLQTALLAFAGISLFVGAFIIFNTFSITVAQRSREFALLRMLGAGRRQILTSVLAEGAILGIAGSLIGLAFGVAVASGLRALFRVVGFELPSNGTVIETRTVVVSLVVGTVVTLIASIAPALRATRVPPIAALRDDAVQPTARRSRFALPLAVLLTAAGVAAMAIGLFGSLESSSALTFVGVGAGAMFIGVALLSPRLVRPIAALVGAPLARVTGLTGRLARENTIRQPGRTAVTAAALMVGVALVAFASIFAAGAKTTVSGYIDQGLEGQAVVQNTDGFSAFSSEATRAVNEVPGVRTAAGLRYVEGRVKGEKTFVNGVGPTFPDVYRIDEAVGRLDTRSVALKKEYAEDQGLEVGDTLGLSLRKDAELELRVATIFEDDAQLSDDIVVSSKLLERETDLAKDSLVIVGFDDGADEAATLTAISRRLDDDFPAVEALTTEEFKKDFAGQIDQTLGLIYALLALTIIVSLFGIVNTLVLSITERTRELGMLRAVGMSRRQVRRMIRYEAVITSLIGALLGLVLGVVLSILVTQPLDDFEISFPPVTLIGLLVLGAVAGVLAAILPARRASRLDPLKALAYE